MAFQEEAAGGTRRLAYYISLSLSLLTGIAFAMAIATPPLSGPFCTAGCYAYPYADTFPRFPRDYLWMYASLAQLLAFVVFLACVHHLAAPEKKLYSLLSMYFGGSAALVLFCDYFLQLTVVPASQLAGETEGLSLMSQYNPHGIFIALEEIGYSFMGIAFLFLAGVFAGQTKVERLVRVVLVAGFALVCLAWVAISLRYGLQREYRVEVPLITIDWLVLIASGILVNRLFSRKYTTALNNFLT